MQEHIERLSQHPFYKVRAGVARWHNTRHPILRILGYDPKPFVRAQLANNPQAPQELLVKLAQDKELSVRTHLAYNEATPRQSLTKLAQDPEDAVRRALAWNPAISDAALVQLTNDNNPQVAWCAELNWSYRQIDQERICLDSKQYPLERQPFSIRYVAVMHPNTTAATLQKLSSDNHPSIQTGLVRHPNTALHTVQYLFKLGKPHIIMGAASNINIFNINKDLGRKMTQSLTKWVDTESNQRSDPESIQKIRQRLAKCAADHNTPSQTLSILGRSTHPGIAQLVAQHSGTPRETLSQMASPTGGSNKSKRILQRWVAKNPSAATTTLEQLAVLASQELRQLVTNTNMKEAPLEMELGSADQAHLGIALNLALNPSTPKAIASAMAMQVIATQPWYWPSEPELLN